jgi:uncharacterized protein
VDADAYLGREEARQLYVNGDAAHDFDHVLRVVRLADQIAQAEGANVTVVRLAALLHDAPADKGDGMANHSARDGHHLAAAATAGKLLRERGLGTDESAQVVHCIEAHRFRDNTIQPQTLEAKCLYDADKLDSIGAIGVGRAFAYAGAHDHRLWTGPGSEVLDTEYPPQGADYTPVHEYIYKLRHVADALYTETARRIGRERHAFMSAFFARLDEEMRGLA